MNITLNTFEVAELFSELNPTGGGFQSLISKLQAQCDSTNGSLHLDPSDLERIPRYAFDYDQGGWENQLKRIFSRTLGPNLE